MTRFGKIVQVFVGFLTVYFLFDKMFNIVWQICCIPGLIFIFANGQILKHNLTIWSPEKKSNCRVAREEKNLSATYIDKSRPVATQAGRKQTQGTSTIDIYQPYQHVGHFSEIFADLFTSHHTPYTPKRDLTKKVPVEKSYKTKSPKSKTPTSQKVLLVKDLNYLNS